MGDLATSAGAGSTTAGRSPPPHPRQPSEDAEGTPAAGWVVGVAPRPAATAYHLCFGGCNQERVAPPETQAVETASAGRGATPTTLGGAAKAAPPSQIRSCDPRLIEVCKLWYLCKLELSARRKEVGFHRWTRSPTPDHGNTSRPTSKVPLLGSTTPQTGVN